MIHRLQYSCVLFMLHALVVAMASRPMNELEKTGMTAEQYSRFLETEYGLTPALMRCTKYPAELFRNAPRAYGDGNEGNDAIRFAPVLPGAAQLAFSPQRVAAHTHHVVDDIARPFYGAEHASYADGLPNEGGDIRGGARQFDYSDDSVRGVLWSLVEPLVGWLWLSPFRSSPDYLQSTESIPITPRVTSKEASTRDVVIARIVARERDGTPPRPPKGDSASELLPSALHMAPPSSSSIPSPATVDSVITPVPVSVVPTVTPVIITAAETPAEISPSGVEYPVPVSAPDGAFWAVVEDPEEKKRRQAAFEAAARQHAQAALHRQVARDAEVAALRAKEFVTHDDSVDEMEQEVPEPSHSP